MNNPGVFVANGQGVAAVNDNNLLAYIRNLAQDTNGPDVYSNDKALFGYISAEKYLIVTDTFYNTVATRTADAARYARNPTVDVELLGGVNGISDYLGASGMNYRASHDYLIHSMDLELFKVLLMNYHAATTYSKSKADAWVIAALRVRWLSLGGLDVATDDPHVCKQGVRGNAGTAELNEVLIKTDKNSAGVYKEIYRAVDMAELRQLCGPLIVEVYNHMGNPDYGNSWINSIAETTWCCVEHMFRVRGHHYKDEYEPLFRRYFNACFEGNDPIPAGISPDIMCHTAIHPFGVRALPVLAAHFVAFGKVGNAAIIRFSGAPTGTAVITTTWAGMQLINGEAWYESWKEVNKDNISKLDMYFRAIMANKYGYHLASALYGIQRINSTNNGQRNVTFDEMRADISPISASIQGAIDAMKEAQKNQYISKFSMSSAKALERASGDAPLSTYRTRAIVELGINLVLDSKNIKEAVELAFPRLGYAASAANLGPTPGYPVFGNNIPAP